MSIIQLKGNDVHTSGQLPAVGTTIKDFILVNTDLTERTLSDYAGQRKIISIFPSIDTGVCATSVRKFNELASALDNTVVINVSKDLPFAMKRFCGAEGLENVDTLSDFRGNFGADYGVLMTDSGMKGLLSRAVLVVNETNQVLYAEQVPEITQEPNYEAALAVLN